MEALRQYLGLGPIVSIGTSYGAVVAMVHAVRYLQAVSHLVLVAAVAHHRYVTRAKELVTQRGTAEQISMIDDFFAGRFDPDESMRRFFTVMASLYSTKYDPSVAN